MIDPDPTFNLDFSNTEIAFRNKTDKQLKKTAWLFGLMNNSWLVNIGSKVGFYAVKWRLPLADLIVRQTIFEQFCGGENLLNSQSAIDNLYDHNVLTVLDYGAEGKSKEDDLDNTLRENLNAISMAASNSSVPIISIKITGLVDNAILEKVSAQYPLNPAEERQWQRLKDRLTELSDKATDYKVGIFIDAEESWLQNAIDLLAMDLILTYNKEKAIIYNTYQMYRVGMLDRLKKDHQTCLAQNVTLGAKLVRGAYMDKERRRAEDMGYNSPIQPNKAATDIAFDQGIQYCVEHHLTISSCCASHNDVSNKVQAELIHRYKIAKDHPHLNFCQLYGMSDHLTFNLAQAGYNASKYVVYGPIKDVIPYLIRRTEENTSVTGEMSREFALVNKELIRRGLKK